jgi:hypothetical protein
MDTCIKTTQEHFKYKTVDDYDKKKKSLENDFKQYVSRYWYAEGCLFNMLPYFTEERIALRKELESERMFADTSLELIKKMMQDCDTQKGRLVEQDKYDKTLSQPERFHLCMKHCDDLEVYHICRNLSDIDRPFMRSRLSVKAGEKLLTRAINMNDPQCVSKLLEMGARPPKDFYGENVTEIQNHYLSEMFKIGGPLYKKSRCELFGRLGLDNTHLLQKAFRKIDRVVDKQRLNDKITDLKKRLVHKKLVSVFKQWNEIVLESKRVYEFDEFDEFDMID